MVDLLLNGSCGHKLVDGHLLFLTNSPQPLSGSSQVSNISSFIPPKSLIIFLFLSESLVISLFLSPVVDLLLYGPSGQQPVDGDLLVLTNPPRPLPGLSVGAGVPVRVVDDDPVGSGQIHTKTPHTGGQEEEEDTGVLFNVNINTDINLMLHIFRN